MATLIYVTLKFYQLRNNKKKKRKTTDGETRKQHVYVSGNFRYSLF